MSRRILEGILVVDLSRYLPGPFATSELQRLGARVVRLEAPAGDPLRRLAPGWHARLNAGKESVVCDLKSDSALGRALCKRADVVVESFRPGVVERLGVGPGDLPGTVVYCSISGFGEDSPCGQRPVHDVNCLGLAGVLDPDSPSLPPLQIADLTAGLTAVARILGALYARERSGLGSVERVSMTEEAHRLVAYRRGGATPIPRFLEGGLACYGLYRAADAAWLSVGALEEPFFRRLCELLGAPELAARQFDPHAQRDLRARLEPLLAARPAADWMRVFAAEDVAVAPVVALDDAIVGAPGGDVPELPLGRDTELWRQALTDAA